MSWLPFCLYYSTWILELNFQLLWKIILGFYLEPTELKLSKVRIYGQKYCLCIYKYSFPYTKAFFRSFSIISCFSMDFKILVGYIPSSFVVFVPMKNGRFFVVILYNGLHKSLDELSIFVHMRVSYNLTLVRCDSSALCES